MLISLINQIFFQVYQPKNFPVFIIPQRYVLGIMGFLAIVNAYTMRVTLSVAITEMVEPTMAATHHDPDACPGSLANTSTVTVSTNLDLGQGKTPIVERR